MKTTPSRLVVAAAGVLLCASCGSQLETTTTTVPMSTASVAKSDGSLAGTIHAQVNAYRAAKGKSQLSRHAGLDKMAREHSEFMLRNRGKFKVDRTSSLSHYGFEERAFKAQRMMSMGDVAENIATCSGQGSASSVLVNAWKNSSGHERNMRGMFNATGIGVAVDSDGTVFATQLFGLEDHSHLTKTRRMRQF